MRRHKSNLSRIGFALATAIAVFAGPCGAQDASVDAAEDPYAGERLCFRPIPPDRLDYPDREEFNAEKESYFRQSSIYIDCIDQWIDDARRTYMEMFRQEAQSYLDERKDVLEELRIFGQEQRRQ